MSSVGGVVCAVLTDGTVGVWNIANGALQFLHLLPLPRHFETKSDPSGSCLCPIGKRVAIALEQWIVVWQVAQPHSPLILQCGASVTSIAFAPDGKQLVAIDQSGKALSFDMDLKDVVAEITAHAQPDAPVRFLPDSQSCLIELRPVDGLRHKHLVAPLLGPKDLDLGLQRVTATHREEPTH
jgi:hypothetical protein